MLRAIAFALIVSAGVNVAHASFHLMQIEQVIGGVDGDTSAQAIQLRMRSAGENLVSSARLIVVDAAGNNPILVKDMTSNVTHSSAGDHILIVSASFANAMSATPGFSSDFTMTQTIPASYLAAGRLIYEDDFGTVYWSVSWGGSGYTGLQTGSTLNDADGNFGPAFGSPLASSSRQAVKFSGAASAASTSNQADYALSAEPAIVMNNASNAFTVVHIAKPSITAISRETNNIRVTWTTVFGKTNFLQRATGTANGGLSTNFTDIFTVTNNLGSVTNYLDLGAVTNSKSAYYRLRLP